MFLFGYVFFFFKQKTAYEIKECDWSSDVCSSDLFPKWRITLVVPEKMILAGLRNLTLLRYTEKQLTHFASPKKSLVENLLKSEFDLTIDLSPAYDFTNLALVWKIGTGLRFGFYHPTREDFYNFLLRQRADAEPSHAYQSLVNTIRSL